MVVQREGEEARSGTLSQPVLDVAVVVKEISVCLSPSLVTSPPALSLVCIYI